MFFFQASEKSDKAKEIDEKMIKLIKNSYSKCSEILNTSCLPKKPRQTMADTDQTASEEAV